MTKIIGFTGSHGTGKSTLLEELRRTFAQTDDVVIDTHSVSRESQAQLGAGAALVDIVNDLDRMMALQNIILQKKSDHLTKLRSANPDARFILTDRSPVDFVAYTCLWIEQNLKEQEPPEYVARWLKAYVSECLVDVSQQYSAVVYFPANRFPFVSEAARGSAETHTRHDQLTSKTLAIAHVEVVTLDSVALSDRRVEVCYKLGLTP